MIVKIETYHGFNFIDNVTRASVMGDEDGRPVDTEEVILVETIGNSNYADVFRTIWVQTPEKSWYIRTNSRVWLLSDGTGKTIDRL